MPSLHIRRLESGGVITNYHCISRCSHCLYNSGPHRSRDYLDESMAEAIFLRVISSGCRSVHIGGGEPLLDPQRLMAVIRAARRSGVGIDYVETNSGWYADAGNALDMLAGLKADLGCPIPAGRYPLIDQLTATGIAGLYKLAKQKYGYQPKREGYLNHCDLCTDIRAFLYRKSTNQFSELSPEGFYSEA